MFVIYVMKDGDKFYYSQGIGVVYRWYEGDTRENWVAVPWVGY